MRCLVLLLSIFALAASYYMPRAVYNFSPYRYEGYARMGDDSAMAADPVRKDKKATDFLAVKRFKSEARAFRACYYSPIQCVLKRRK